MLHILVVLDHPQKLDLTNYKILLTYWILHTN